MVDRTAMLTPAGRAMVNGGMPEFRGYFQHGAQLYGQWADGSLAVARYQSGVIIGWQAVPPASYVDLFTRTDRVETMPDAPHD